MPLLEEQQRQESVSQQLPVYPSNYYPAAAAQFDNDFLKFRVKTDDIIRDIEHKLKGEVWDGSRWMQKYSRWLNDEGISVILSIISNYVTRKVSLGNFTKEE